MKEIENISDVYTDIGNGEIVPDIINNLYKAFLSAKTIDKKYKAYMDFNDYITMRRDLGQDLTNEEQSIDNEISSSFMKSITDMNTEDAKLLFTAMGRELVDKGVAFDKENKWLNKIIDPSDPDHDMKVNYLFSVSASVHRYDNRLVSQAQIKDRYFNDDNMYNLMSNSSIVQDTNMKDFAKECGYSANKIDNYLNQIHADPNNNVYEHFERSLRKERMRADLQNQDNLSDEVLEKAMKDPEKYDKQAYDSIEISVEDIVGATAKEFSARTIDNFITKGMKYQVKKHNITLDRYNEIQNAKTAERMNMEKISEWTKEDGEGVTIRNALSNARSRGYINDLYKRYNMSKKPSFDQYILRHSGYEATHKDFDKASDVLANSIAASMLKKSAKKFDLDLIHRTAQSVKQMQEFKEISADPVKICCCLADPKTVEITGKNIIERTYGVKPERIKEYIQKMTTLYDNMKSVGSQSAEYKRFKQAVEKIKLLGTECDLSTEGGRQRASAKVSNLNAKLLSESANYMKGKKSVRGTTEGQNRFNNALDSLGILSEFAPKTASQINVIIDRINKVRNAEGDSKNRVKLSDYNEKRSAEASKIDSKKQNIRSK